MTTETIIEAVRNIKSQQLFILLGESMDNRYKILNSKGEILNLPATLFDDDPVFVPSEQFEEHFSPQQLKAYEKYNERVAAQIDRITSAQQEEARASSAPEPKRGPTKRREKTVVSKTGIGATWSSSRLTFYRHKIQVLQPKQSFRITVEGIGDFVITKDEFLRIFNDVVMSSGYQREGLFAYPTIPDKAMKFLRT